MIILFHLDWVISTFFSMVDFEKKVIQQYAWQETTPKWNCGIIHGHVIILQAAISQGIDCIVAPYEADAQLAYLSISGIAQIIISEDSDLLCFGCERVSYCWDL